MTSRIVKSTAIDERTVGRASRARQACLSYHLITANLACEESSFPRRLLPSASLHPPAESAPHHLLTVPRGPAALMGPPLAIYTPHTGLVSSRAAGPDTQGRRDSTPCPVFVNVIRRQRLFSVPIFSTGHVHRPPARTAAIRSYVTSESVVSARSRTPARALTHGKAAIHKQARPAEPPDRSICFNRSAAMQVPSLNLQRCIRQGATPSPNWALAVP